METNFVIDVALQFDRTHFTQEYGCMTDKQEPQEQWLTAIEASEIMGIKPKTIANYCRDGKLECRKRGRDWYVSREAAETFVKSNVGRPIKDDL